MKATLLVALAAAALGAAAGALVPSRRAPAPAADVQVEAPESPPVPEEPLVSHRTETPPDVEDVRARLEQELKALLENPATWSREQKLGRLEELKRRAAELAKKRDRWGLFGLAHDMTALGEDGYAPALELVKDLALRPGSDVDALLDAADGPMLPFWKWALTGAKGADESLRLLATQALARHADQDPDLAAWFSTCLSSETSGSVAALLAAALPRLSPTPLVPALGPTLPARPTDRPDALLAYLRALRESAWSDAERRHVLARLEGDASPVVATAAAAARVALDPPARGVLVEWLQPGSAPARGGLLPGDIVVSVDGEAPDDGPHARELAWKAAGESVLVKVHRDGREITFAWMKPASDLSGMAGTFVEPR